MASAERALRFCRRNSAHIAGQLCSKHLSTWWVRYFVHAGHTAYLPYSEAYVEALHLPASTGTWLIALMNAASVPGILVLGHLSDRAPLRAVVLLSALGSALACLLLWGFATRIDVLVVFALVFGFLGLSFSGVWAALITVIASERFL
jgi:MFS family permease